MTKPITSAILSLLVVILFGCRKPNEDKEEITNPNFKYSTTKDLSINLKFLSADNKPLKHVLVNFYYPDKGLTDPVYKALTDSNGVLQGNFAAPTYKTALVADLKYPGVTRNITMFLENNTITGTIKSNLPGSAISFSKHDKTSGVDSDGDTVEDIFDEFPNDNKRAYTKYYPSQNSWNTCI